MPRFYFDIADGSAQTDETGRDLADASDVCFEIRRTLSDLVMSGDVSTSTIVKVRGEDNQTIATATISLAVHFPETHH